MNNDPTAREQVALLTAHEGARLLNGSERHLRRLSDRGAMPQPVRLGTLVRWRRDEIEQWIAAGCPA
jgi:excisionase family DNA binding protein